MKPPQFLWTVVVLVMTVAYLLQIMPHGHTAAHHCESHPAPPLHTHHEHHGLHGHDGHHDHHTHDPADVESGQESSGPGHHQHEVSPHLDVHFLRNLLIEVSTDQLDSAIPAATSATTATRPADDQLVAAFAASIPDDPLLLHAPSRAPPA